jgi:hypothetical protein
MHADALCSVPLCRIQWRIPNFSKLTSTTVWSECFEAGICTWWVGVHHAVRQTVPSLQRSC